MFWYPTLLYDGFNPTQGDRPHARGPVAPGFPSEHTVPSQRREVRFTSLPNATGQTGLSMDFDEANPGGVGVAVRPAVGKSHEIAGRPSQARSQRRGVAALHRGSAWDRLHWIRHD